MGTRFTSVSRSLARETLFAFLFFTACAVLFTWPLAARLRSGMPDLFDDKLNAWIFHWDFHQTFRHPLRLFDANIFYPARDTLAFSENLFGAAVFGFPLFALGASTLLTANVLMLAGMAFSGLAAWALAREVTGDPAASLIAGVVYAFVPWRIAQLPHVQFQWGAFLALILLFLLRALDRGTRRDAALFGLFFAWNALTNVHYALFSGFLVALVLLHGLLSRERPVFLPRLRRVLLAAALAGCAVLPFYIPYFRASRVYGMVRGEGEIESFSGRAIDFLTAGPQNKLYAPLTQKWAHAEGDFFPGVTPIVLAALAVVRLRGTAASRGKRPSRGRLRTARILDALIAAGLLAWIAAAVFHRSSLGPIRMRDPGRILAFAGLLAAVRVAVAFPRWSRYADLADFARRTRLGSRALLFLSIAALGVLIALGTHTPFYRLLVQSAGGIFRSIRVPGRGIVLFDLALGVLAAWGLALAAARWPPLRRRVVLAAALALIVVEYRAFPIEIGDAAEQAAPVYHWLAAVPVRGAAVEWPMTVDVEPEHVFRSTAHWKPLVNGYSGFAPPAYDALSGLTRETPIPDTVWRAMRALGGSILIFHPSETSEENRKAHLDALRRGVSEGRLQGLAAFPRAGTDLNDLAFRITGTPPFAAPVPPDRALASPAATLEMLTRIETRLTAPFGVVERPREGEIVGAGYWAFGWALDDSGVARVRLFAPGAPPVECISHQPFPGVSATYPKNPESGLPGYGCPVPSLPRGPQVLSFEIAGQDGGTTTLRRAIRVP